MSASAGASSPSTDVPALELHGLTKDFAIGLRGVRLRAVDGLTLRVAAGQIYGLLGPNGSGKSTTIKLALGLLEPSAGSCAIFGVPSSRVEARCAVGYMPEAPNFYRHLSGRGLVRFYARLCGVETKILEGRVDDVLALVGLADAADRRVGTYSKGMLQRIGLAQALVHDPRFLILDEPTAGVDPLGAAEMCELIRRLKIQGKTILITSHLLAHLEEICDRVAILDRGRLVLEGGVAELVGRDSRQAVMVDQLSVAELEELRAWLAARGRKLESVELSGARLDRVFVEHVQGRRRP